MKTLLALCASALLLPGAALAQTSSQPSQQGDTQQPSQSNSQSTMNEQSQSNSAQDQTIEGCVIKQSTAYYITPINSSTGAQVKLDSNSQDLSSVENKDVRVTGHYENQSGSNESNTTTSSSQSGQQGTNPATSSSQSGQEMSPNTSGQYGQSSTNQGNNNSGVSGTSSGSASGNNFLVTKVETVSTNCPH